MKSLLLIAAPFLPYACAKQCSCSPTQYTFRLDLESNCELSTISEEQDGINGSLCLFAEGSSSGTNVSPGEMTQIGKGGIGLRKLQDHVTMPHIQHNAQRRQQNLNLASTKWAPTSPIMEVTSILFLEVDTTPELNVINQDSTYLDMNLPSESLITYASVSNHLDPKQPLEKQMEYVPGGVVVVLFGNDEDGNVVQNTVAWNYGGAEYCESEPVAVGDTLGWIVIDDYQPAKAAFCPAVEALPPTPSPTIAAIATDTPTSPPFKALETEPPTITNVFETTTSTEAATTEEPRLFPKSAKDTSMSYAGKVTKLFKESKASKATKLFKESKSSKVFTPTPFKSG